MKDVESSNSEPFNNSNFNEMLSTSSFGINLQMFYVPSLKMNPLHVIFDLIRILMATCFKVVQNASLLI
jgi:hypothetical protein